MRQKKKKKLGVAVVLLANVFFWGGGKCPNLGVVNVRILGVVNVRLANNLTLSYYSCPQLLVSKRLLKVKVIFLEKD